MSDIQVTAVDGNQINVSTGTVVGPLPELQLAAGNGINITSSNGVSTISTNLTTPANLTDLSDVSGTPAAGQLLSYNGSSWSASTVAIPANLGDLGDVNVTPSAGQILSYDGGGWAAVSVANAANLADLGDVSNASAASGQALTWNGTSWAPANVPVGTTVNNLSGNLSLVAGTNINISANGQQLTIGTIGAATISNLTDLVDVNASMTPTTGEALVWDGTEWTADAVTALVSNGTTLDLGTGKILYSNVYPTLADLPDAASYHGMFAHVHAEGAAYYAHNGNWVQLAHDSDVPSTYVSGLNGLSGSVILAGGNNVQIGQSGNQLTISSTQALTTLNGESGSLSLVGGNGIGISTVNDVITVSATNHTVVNNLAGNVDIVAGSNINVTTNGQNVVISGQSGGITWATEPASSNSTGNAGDIAYGSGFFYLHDGTEWRRAALSTFGVSTPTITITTQPQDLTLADGSSGNFTIAATVSDGSTPSYQWQNSDDSGVTWDTLTGATGTTYALSGVSTLDNGTQYRAIVSATGASDVTSNVATLTVTAAATYDLLAESGDRLMTEAGDSLDHDGTGGGGSGTLWTQVGADIDGEAATDASGYSVAMSSDGSRVAIGAYSNDGAGTYAGHVRVYDLIGSTWTQVGSDIDGEAAEDRSGSSVAISSDGSRIAIGSQYNDGAGTDAGHVRVYDLIGSTWTQVGSDIDGEAAEDYSGLGLAMSSDGSRVAIGAYGNDGAGTYAGHVRVYDLVGSTWTQVGSDIDGEAAEDRSGLGLAMSSDGSRVAIGAGGNDGAGTNAGHVRVFDLVGSTWTQVGADIDAEAAGDQSGSGRSVSMSSDGSRVAIGSYTSNGTGVNAGHVRVYDLVGSTWTQVGADIDGEAMGDQSGYSVAMSSDGSRVAIGAFGNDGAGTNAGHARVYDLIGSTWTQVGADIDGEAAEDYSGLGLAMSSDGSRVAIGAYLNDGAGTNAGHVRVYEWG